MPDFLAEALSWQKSAWVKTALKAARSWGVPPLTMLTGQSTDWSDDKNRRLAMALTILEEETCKNCGTPAWIGHSTNNLITFDLKSSVCYACAELEKEREEREKGRGAKPRMKGETRYARARNVWGEEYPLPSRAHAYQHDMPED